MAVPFADLHLQYETIKTELDAAIASVVRDSAFVRGPYVDAFEQEFAKAVDVRHCVSCANGTDAIYLALRALDVKPGDEVITTAHSWISTSAMITHSGATVVFCDTDGDTFTIDPAAIEAAITPRTVGIVPVHLYGQPADMDAIMAIARKHNLWIVEDCAQAHLATYKGQQIGTFGAASTYSFYPGKNLGAMGDAGAVVTNDKALAEKMAMLARHGGLVKHHHQIEGINSRLDGLQAAILSVKLRHLADWTAKRRAAAQIYNEGLNQIQGVTIPAVAPGRDHVYHLYTLQHERRDELAKHLNANGIQTAINYPVALPFLPAYARLAHKRVQFPNASRQQDAILSIPMFAEITEAQQSDVIEAIRRFS